MSRWVRLLFGTIVLAVTGFLGVPLACDSTTVNDQVGQLKQRCFPGDYCDEGLTCVATALQTDSAPLGSDGGQCELLGDANELGEGGPPFDATGK